MEELLAVVQEENLDKIQAVFEKLVAQQQSGQQQAANGSGASTTKPIDPNVCIDQSMLLASSMGSEKVLEKLLSLGGNPNACDANQITCLHLAAASGIERRKQQQQANNNNSGGGNGSSGEDSKTSSSSSLNLVPPNAVRCVQLLIERKANPNLVSLVDNLPPLHYALLLGGENAALVLLDNTADELIDRPTGDGDTPLHIASSRGSSRIVNALLERGADVNKLNNAGMSAAQVAVMSRYPAVNAILTAAAERKRLGGAGGGGGGGGEAMNNKQSKRTTKSKTIHSAFPSSNSLNIADNSAVVVTANRSGSDLASRMAPIKEDQKSQDLVQKKDDVMRMEAVMQSSLSVSSSVAATGATTPQSLMHTRDDEPKDSLEQRMASHAAKMKRIANKAKGDELVEQAEAAIKVRDVQTARTLVWDALQAYALAEEDGIRGVELVESLEEVIEAEVRRRETSKAKARDALTQVRQALDAGDVQKARAMLEVAAVAAADALQEGRKEGREVAKLEVAVQAAEAVVVAMANDLRKSMAEKRLGEQRVEETKIAIEERDLEKARKLFAEARAAFEAAGPEGSVGLMFLPRIEKLIEGEEVRRSNAVGVGSKFLDQALAAFEANDFVTAKAMAKKAIEGFEDAKEAGISGMRAAKKLEQTVSSQIPDDSATTALLLASSRGHAHTELGLTPWKGEDAVKGLEVQRDVQAEIMKTKSIDASTVMGTLNVNSSKKGDESPGVASNHQQHQWNSNESPAVNGSPPSPSSSNAASPPPPPLLHSGSLMNMSTAILAKQKSKANLNTDSSGAATALSPRNTLQAVSEWSPGDENEEGQEQHQQQQQADESALVSSPPLQCSPQTLASLQDILKLIENNDLFAALQKMKRDITRLASVGDLDLAGIVRCRINLAALLWLSGRPAKASTVLDAALTHAEAARLEEESSMCGWLLAGVMAVRGGWIQGTQLLAASAVGLLRRCAGNNSSSLLRSARILAAVGSAHLRTSQASEAVLFLSRALHKYDAVPRSKDCNWLEQETASTHALLAAAMLQQHIARTATDNSSARAVSDKDVIAMVLLPEVGDPRKQTSVATSDVLSLTRATLKLLGKMAVERRRGVVAANAAQVATDVASAAHSPPKKKKSSKKKSSDANANAAAAEDATTTTTAKEEGQQDPTDENVRNGVIASPPKPFDIFEAQLAQTARVEDSAAIFFTSPILVDGDGNNNENGKDENSERVRTEIDDDMDNYTVGGVALPHIVITSSPSKSGVVNNGINGGNNPASGGSGNNNNNTSNSNNNNNGSTKKGGKNSKASDKKSNQQKSPQSTSNFIDDMPLAALWKAEQERVRQRFFARRDQESSFASTMEWKETVLFESPKALTTRRSPRKSVVAAETIGDGSEEKKTSRLSDGGGGSSSPKMKMAAATAIAASPAPGESGDNNNNSNYDHTFAMDDRELKKMQLQQRKMQKMVKMEAAKQQQEELQYYYSSRPQKLTSRRQKQDDEQLQQENGNTSRYRNRKSTEIDGGGGYYSTSPSPAKETQRGGGGGGGGGLSRREYNKGREKPENDSNWRKSGTRSENQFRGRGNASQYPYYYGGDDSNNNNNNSNDEDDIRFYNNGGRKNGSRDDSQPRKGGSGKTRRSPPPPRSLSTDSGAAMMMVYGGADEGHLTFNSNNSDNNNSHYQFLPAVDSNVSNGGAPTMMMLSKDEVQSELQQMRRAYLRKLLNGGNMWAM